MSARSMWAGTIAFGMVVIPVKMYLATADDREDLTFRQVRRSDGSRIQFRRVSSADGAEVSYADIAKGLEWGTEVIVFTDEELATLPVPTTKQIRITQFCDPDEIDPMLFDKSYYLAPDKGAERAYWLLRRAMRGQRGIGKVVIGSRERLVMLRSEAEGIVLTTLRLPDGVRAFPEFPVPLGKGDDAEFAMALAIVRSMTAKFKPEEHVDQYAVAVRKLADDRVNGVKPEVAVPDQGSQALSLMATLQASVAALKKEAGE